MLEYCLVNWAEHKGKFCIEVWPEGAGVMPDGSFDIDAWEASKVFIAPKPGENIRTAFYEGMSGLRKVAKHYGGLRFIDPTDTTNPARLPG